MKALLVIENDTAAVNLAAALTPLGCECIRYRQPLKAMDNMEEIEPQLLVISANDFPRHWKPFVQFSANITESPPAVFLIFDSVFSEDEERKVKALGIQETIPSPSSYGNLQNDLKSLLIKHKLLKQESPEAARHVIDAEDNGTPENLPSENKETDSKAQNCEPEVFNQIEPEHLPETIKVEKQILPQFMFINPENGSIITGKTLSKTEDGIIFQADWPDMLEGIQKGTILNSCILQMGNDNINPRAEVLHMGSELEITFI